MKKPTCRKSSFYKLSAIAGLVIAATLQSHAQNLFSDNFSTYNLGDLDANESGGPNQDLNNLNGLNPWWGPNPGNMVVATSYNSITPYAGGTHLIYGNSPSFFAEQDMNAAYRFNGGNNFTGGVKLSWAFYDPVGTGANASGYDDIAYFNGYQTADGYTSTADYTGSGSGVPDPQGHFTSGDMILGLGANNTSGANTSVYQARGLFNSTPNHGATSANGNGWFNLGVTRTVGWHTGAIEIGAANGANTTFSMFIDGTDVLDGTLTGSSMDALNTVVLDGGFGSQVGAFDNVSLDQVVVPEPGTVGLLAAGGALMALAQWRRKKQA